jgi:hypothetical protein
MKHIEIFLLKLYPIKNNFILIKAEQTKLINLISLCPYYSIRYYIQNILIH